jgi:hypothetical protein
VGRAIRTATAIVAGVLLVWQLPSMGTRHGAALVTKGDRLLGIDATPTELNTYDSVQTAQHFLGVQAVQLMIDWKDIETAPGVYSDRYLKPINDYYPAMGVQVSFTLRPIDARHKNVPADLADVPFDDPVMIYRFFAVLDYVFAQLPDVTFASFGVGNEVDEHFRLHLETLPAYKIFYDAAVFHIKQLRPDVRVGVSMNLHALTRSIQSGLFEHLNEHSDVVLVLYYPVDLAFNALDPSVIDADLEQLTARYWYKPIHFREAGYPSAPEASGSLDAQRAFVERMFAAWDAHADRIQLVTFFRLTDFAPEEIDYYANYYQSQTVPFRAFLNSLGLRTWAGDGDYKPAFWQLMTEARARGW